MSGYLQLTSLVLVLVACVAAQPQRAVQAADPKGQVTNGAPGDFNLLPEGTRLSELTDQDLQEFFTNTEAVAEFTECLVNPRGCKSRSGRNLVRQVTSLKSRGQCDDCSPTEQTRLNDIIYYFIKTYRDKYPEHWDRALPRVLHIVAGLAAR